MYIYYDYYEKEQAEMLPEQESKKSSPFADSDYLTPIDAERQTDTQALLNKKKSKFIGVVVKAFLLILVCCVITGVVVDARWQKRMALSNQVQSNKIAVLQEQIDWLSRINTENNQEAALVGQLNPGQVYAQNVPAVVAIASQGTTTNIYGQASQTASSGSGFLISADGYVVTNYHVVSGASSLSVLTYDGEVYRAEQIGFDEGNDICVLKIQGKDFPFVTIGSSNALGVGDQVAAIGNPLGELTSTLTVGYISAKDRVVTTDGNTINMLQTDAAINSGNSGGPLFNMNGEVVGITTAKYSGTTDSGAVIEGIGFAIPIDDVLDMIRDLKEHGHISGAYLGVAVMDVSESAQMYGLPAGAYVDDVTSGSAADQAGIQKQDIIVNVGGYNVSSMGDLTRVLRKFKAGDTTTISVYRAGQQMDLSITFDEKPKNINSLQTNEEKTEENQSNWLPDKFWENIPGGIFDFFFNN